MKTATTIRLNPQNMMKTIHTLLALTAIGLPTILSAADSSTLINSLENVPAAEIHFYQLRDNDGRSMDCLKVFQPADGKSAGVYYGLYHNQQKGVLSAHLARSEDLRVWKHVAVLDEHASQPTVWLCDNGACLVAYEKDKPNACWMRIRYYESLADLSTGKHARAFDIERTLAPTAEGTPSFESVTIGKNGMDTSQIQLRFHYFKNAQVDQLARGTLTDFKVWKAEPSDTINAERVKQGWHGNLGDRDRFVWQGDVYYLQEIQRVKGDWSSWRICLCAKDSMPVHTLAITTHKASTAFANPNATWVTDANNQRKLVVTLFLPSEGNHSSEAGTLLYVINPTESLHLPSKEMKATP